jgi:hypothetical protein
LIKLSGKQRLVKKGLERFGYFKLNSAGKVQCNITSETNLPPFYNKDCKATRRMVMLENIICSSLELFTHSKEDSSVKRAESTVKEEDGMV